MGSAIPELSAVTAAARDQALRVTLWFNASLISGPLIYLFTLSILKPVPHLKLIRIGRFGRARDLLKVPELDYSSHHVSQSHLKLPPDRIYYYHSQEHPEFKFVQKVGSKPWIFDVMIFGLY